MAERGLKTIVFREEGEKMNLWVALMNLEHKYGSTESVEAVLARAAQQCNPKHMHLHAVDMYERAGETDRAEAMLEVRKGEGAAGGSVLIPHADQLRSQ